MRSRGQLTRAIRSDEDKYGRAIFIRTFVCLLGICGASVLVTLLWVKGAEPLPASISNLGFGMVVVVAGISFALSNAIARASSRLSQQILSSEPATGPLKKRRLQSLVFSEVITAWKRTNADWEHTLNQEHCAATRSRAELEQFMLMVAKAVEERASHLLGHSERVAMYSSALASQLGLEGEEVERIELAALVHDLGMISLDDRVLRNTGLLLAEEFEILKAHPAKGASLLRPVESLQDLIPGVELHHESIDGRGYPYGLSDGEIPLMARIIAVADAFDAMTTDRPYQSAMTPKYVLEIMGRMAGMRYDAQVVGALKELVMNGSIVVASHRAELESLDEAHARTAYLLPQNS